MMKWIAATFLTLTLIAASLIATPAQHLTSAQATAFCADSEEVAFLQIINAYRAGNGLQPLAFSQALGTAAEAHSQDMAITGVFGHVGSNGSTVEQRLIAAGYTDFNASGENVFAGDATASGAFEAWRNSPGHNANMLGANFNAIGIARVNNPDSLFGWYWTTTFGSTVDAAACVGGTDQPVTAENRENTAAATTTEPTAGGNTNAVTNEATGG